MTLNNIDNIPIPIKPKRAGRPSGSRNRRTIFVEQLFTENNEDVKAVVATAIAKAIEGDADFAKLVLDRIAPVMKGRLMTFPLPPIKSLEDVITAYGGLLAAVSQGLITSAESIELSAVIERLGKALADHELEARIVKLEKLAER